VVSQIEERWSGKNVLEASKTPENTVIPTRGRRSFYLMRVRIAGMPGVMNLFDFLCPKSLLQREGLCKYGHNKQRTSATTEQGGQDRRSAV
jgi:hypothetical protein